METRNTPWSVGALFICTKCGKAFDRPQQAEDLKTDLRSFLKEKNQQKDIRVMVSSCLNICEKEFQAVCYQPTSGSTEVFVVNKDYKKAKEELQSFLEKKVPGTFSK